MSGFYEVVLRGGTAQFAGSIRGVDDNGHDVFRVSLVGLPAMYGEWRPKFAENGNDFDIEIPGFGWGDKLNIANPAPTARIKCSATDIAKIMEAVSSLFSSKQATSQISPFTSRVGRFLGHLIFLPGWIIEASR